MFISKRELFCPLRQTTGEKTDRRRMEAAVSKGVPGRLARNKIW